MRLAAASVCALLAWAPAVALAAPTGAHVVLRGPGEPAFHDGPANARVGELVEATVVLDAPRGRTAPLPDGARVEWHHVEARPMHVSLPPQNPGNATYSNSVLLGPHHGDWIGFDTIEYDDRPLVRGPGIEVDGATARVRAAHPSDAQLDAHGGAGSLWLSAVITLADGTVVRTPGVTDVDRLGLSSRVARVSFRDGDDFVGWLGTYFGVPDVFGSSGGPGSTHQADRYVGADCADSMVGGLRASGRRELTYGSVSSLPQIADEVSGVLAIDRQGVVRDEAGNEAHVRWGDGVRRGDLLVIDYTDDPNGDLPRAWDHVGALVGDAPGGVRGELDGADLLRNMEPRGLWDDPLLSQTPMRVRILRVRPPHAARRSAHALRTTSGAPGRSTSARPSVESR